MLHFVGLNMSRADAFIAFRALNSLLLADSPFSLSFVQLKAPYPLAGPLKVLSQIGVYHLMAQESDVSDSSVLDLASLGSLQDVRHI